jgi:DNA-binding beta-propeller fold protein YncE
MRKLTRRRFAAVGFAASVLGGCASAAPPAAAPPAPAVAQSEYTAFVASESADEVSRIRFGPNEARVDARWEVGTLPADLDGPHGLSVSPDGQWLYVSIAHGRPFGTLWKMSTQNGEVAERVELGLFPATIGVTPDGEYGFVANFNLHGDPEPSSISKVRLSTLEEVERTTTCVKPHGGRVNAAGTKEYSTCVGDGMLVEIDVASGEVSRKLALEADSGSVCAPTWATPSTDGSHVYVACNAGSEVVEIDVGAWAVSRRFVTGANPYNLAVTPDGERLLATLKNRSEPATEIIDLASGRTLARVPATTVLPHGVAVTGDSRYAVVSVEGVGSEPGKVDVIDLRSLRRVASVEVGQQAGGIDVLPLR